jgi:putative ABC transport system permease protein
VAGVFLSLILIFVINRQVFGWTLQVTIPLPFALGTLVLLVLATIAASYRPAQQAARVHLTEAIQYE